MILSSVTKHVKEQNWFAVFIDFIIVVVGVFVGIQVSNWNQIQIDNNTAGEYIARIQSDLLDNVRDMNHRNEYFSLVKTHAIAALKDFDKQPESLGQQFLIDSYEASQSLPRLIGRDTYDELLSVGALNTISNLATRQRLAQYYRSSVTSQSILVFVPSYQNELRSTMPYKAQKPFRMGSCSHAFTTDSTGAPIIKPSNSCDLNLSKQQLINAISEIQMSGLKPHLIRVNADIDLKLQLIQVVVNRAKELNQFLEENK